MCGIAGVVDRRGGDQSKAVENQLRCLDHRGPDSSGIYRRGPAALGQTRLAIIDLVTGDPPIANEDGTVGVALNGEIYNYRSIREELKGEGHHLSTRCDTEVLAHLAETLGPVELAGHLDGMFAFAVWDDRRERLVLGRDRLGKKPLYYSPVPGGIVFGSEIKAVVAHPSVSRSLDFDVLGPYLRLGYVPTPRTFFGGVRSVPPGHVLVMDSAGAISVTRYWEPPVPGRNGTERLDVSVDDAARMVRALLTAAVRRRLIADVPLGAFLSGGVDSSAVVAIMAETADRPVRTFTIGFEGGQGFDERPYAKVVADRFSTEHVEFVVDPDAVDLVERLVWHHDQPFGDSSAIPTFLLSELTRRDVTVALCGDGGDELFAGYGRFSVAMALDRYRRLPNPLSAAIGRGVAGLPPQTLDGRWGQVQRFVRRAGMEEPQAFLTLVSYISEERCRDLLPATTDFGEDDFLEKWTASAGGGLLDRLLDLTLRTYLVDDLLPKMDRMSMAHALEVRSPFLDHELVELAMRLPDSARLAGPSRKRVLKRAVRDLLPPEILNRRKHGFSVPVDRWFRGELHGYVESTLASPGARVREHLDAAAIDRLLAEHRTGAANHGDSLWTLLTLELFLRREG